MKSLFYRIRLSMLMYGLARVLQVARIIDKNFRARLAQNDFAFMMGSKEDDTARYFQFTGGQLLSGRSRMPSDFALIWWDNQSGGRVMIEMISGKRKALYKAVMNGTLTLEGEGKYVSLFMETMNQLNRLFGSNKKVKDPGKTN